ncbi:ammonium transporter [Pseudonocardia nematodicida]|uniref:Ammonium transporter n=1 Tax=Pseudonocardia nematodicida TaxID=1206997 RepID=A0ABV1KAD8_9PSEU
MPEADLAWLLAAFALVLLMFPGLALFYGGMMSSRNALNMLMMVMSTLGIASVLYVLIGHSMVSGDSLGGLGLIGNPLEYPGFLGVHDDGGSGGPEDVFWAAFFILFAAITIAIVASGAAGRMKFSGWLVFAPVWLTLVYFPLAHWVFAFDDPETGVVGGWMANTLQMHDYAGGTAVHMNAGVAALALAMVLGPRRSQAERPHNLPVMLLGAGILWFGWMGFNGGTAGGANFLAQYVILTTLLAGAAGMLGFCLIEKLRDGHATTLGLASGMIAGLVAITPSADALNSLGALAVGFAGGAVVAWACTWKKRFGIDESLDAFAVHGVGGIVGTIGVVLIAASNAPAGISGILLGGSWDIVWREIVAVVVTCLYAFGMTYAIAWVLHRTMGLRVDPDAEREGIDRVVHAESAYDIEHGGRISHPSPGLAGRLGSTDSDAPAHGTPGNGTADNTDDGAVPASN